MRKTPEYLSLLSQVSLFLLKEILLNFWVFASPEVTPRLQLLIAKFLGKLLTLKYVFMSVLRLKWDQWPDCVDPHSLAQGRLFLLFLKNKKAQLKIMKYENRIKEEMNKH